MQGILLYRQADRTLSSNKNVHVIKPDKSQGVVILLNSNEYKNKDLYIIS